MKIQITLQCLRCQCKDIVKSGRNCYSDKQNHLCKHCRRQLIGDHDVDYPGCHLSPGQRLKRMLVRRMGIRDIATVEQISIGKVLRSLGQLKVGLPQTLAL